MLAHELLELRGQLGVPADQEPRLEAVLQRRQAQLAQAAQRTAHRCVELELRERRAAPERERPLEDRGGLLGAAGQQCLPPLAAQPLEAVHIEPFRVDPKDVAVQLGHERRVRAPRRHELADLRQVDVQGGGDRARPLGAPHPLDQPLARDGLVGVQEQECEQRALPRAAERERLAVDTGLERPEQRERETPVPFAPRLLRFSPPFACVGERSSGADLTVPTNGAVTG